MQQRTISSWPASEHRWIAAPQSCLAFPIGKDARGGVRKVFFILRNGKWDIPQYYGDGSTIGMDIGYLMMGDRTDPLTRLTRPIHLSEIPASHLVFPDILFQPDDAYKRALKRLNSTRAAIVLGLYPAHKRWTWHTVETDRTGRVRADIYESQPNKIKAGMGFCGLEFEVHGIPAQVSCYAGSLTARQVQN